MLRRLTLFFFALALSLGMFTLTLSEVRRWRPQSAPSPTPITAAVPVRPAVQTSPPPTVDDSRTTALTRAIQRVAPTVVGVTVTQIRYARSPLYEDPFWRFLMQSMPPWFEQKVQSLGSGFIYDPQGYVITNSHVVEGASEITVTLPGGKEFHAKLVGIDKKTDLALLKIDGEEIFPAAPLGNSDDVIIGEWAIALGNPFGLLNQSREPIATAGIVSGIDMDFGIQRSGRVYQNMIQTDASINPGNSGGPLVNAAGEVIGINTFIFTGGGRSSGSIGIGFAIPINHALKIISELRERGYVDRHYTTGLTVQNLDPSLARVLHLDFSEGVLVVEVERNSPADKAGIKVGDVIIGIDNQKVRNDQDIFSYILSNDLRHGDQVVFTLWREGSRFRVQVTLE